MLGISFEPFGALGDFKKQTKALPFSDCKTSRLQNESKLSQILAFSLTPQENWRMSTFLPPSAGWGKVMFLVCSPGRRGAQTLVLVLSGGGERGVPLSWLGGRGYPSTSSPTFPPHPSSSLPWAKTRIHFLPSLPSQAIGTLPLRPLLQLEQGYPLPPLAQPGEDQDGYSAWTLCLLQSRRRTFLLTDINVSSNIKYLSVAKNLAR